MTKDTMRALEIITPIAEELGITIEADDSILYVNNVKIAISCNSTWATLYEFIGYLITEYDREFRSIGLTDTQNENIKRSWYKNR